MNGVSRIVWPADTAERILRLRAVKATWLVIGNEFGVSGAMARAKAISLGILVPRKNRVFTEVEIEYLRDGYHNNTPVEEMATALGRSAGVLRQQYTHKMEDCRGRDPKATRVIRQFGRDALNAGTTPDEALTNIRNGMEQAKQAAREQALKNKRARRLAILLEMHQAIARGADRNQEIFKARATGITLEEIAAEFGITRERVRQIADKFAFDRAMQETLREAAQ